VSAVTATEVIATYERIRSVTGSMLQAARRADWDRLVDLEQACRAEVDSLMAPEARLPALPPEFQARKTQIILSVLADDAEIRRITEPWMTTLEELIGDTRNKRRLAQSYGTGA